MDLKKINVLILGGTKFMGRSLVMKMAANANFEVHIINRMKDHWDNEISELVNITWSYGDRKKHNEFTKYLVYYNKKHGFGEANGGRVWDLVIDFCSYERKDVKSVVRSLSGLVKLYIFISSDSVYEVSCTNHQVFDSQNRLKEESTLRPANQELIAHLANEDEYGHDKLKCEEYLASNLFLNSIPKVTHRTVKFHTWC
jgi:nucleoside-diphosphate-sugar epimerase